MAPTDQLRRQQTCPKCRNHGIISKKKSHKKFCKYETCNCRHCILTDKRRQITKEQTALRRSQKEEEEMGLALPMSQSAFDNDVNLKNLNLLFPDKNISYLNAVLQRNANNLHAAIEKIRGAEGQNSCSSSSFDVKYEIGSPRRPPSWTQNYPSFNYYPPFHQYPQIPQVHPPIPPQVNGTSPCYPTVPYRPQGQYALPPPGGYASNYQIQMERFGGSLPEPSCSLNNPTLTPLRTMGYYPTKDQSYQGFPLTVPATSSTITDPEQEEEGKLVIDEDVQDDNSRFM
uniref:Putative doublesex-and mab-3-related transcription factor 1L n=1 Tax=Solemya velum TaxID=13268 RepID=A0A8F3IZR4_SOLVE|nr:putative doublesex- and mab-3-related transcription factor 1L [Solemya velum]